MTVTVHIARQNATTKEPSFAAREATWAEGGLAVTRAVPTNQGWTITHVGSGLAVAQHIKNEDDARRAAQELLALTDWTRPAPALMKDTQLKKAAWPIYAALEFAPVPEEPEYDDDDAA